LFLLKENIVVDFTYSLDKEQELHLCNIGLVMVKVM